MLEGGRSRINLRPFTDIDEAIRWATTGEEPADMVVAGSAES